MALGRKGVPFGVKGHKLPRLWMENDKRRSKPKPAMLSGKEADESKQHKKANQMKLQ